MILTGAGVAEQADAPDLKSGGVKPRAGSSPAPGTKLLPLRFPVASNSWEKCKSNKPKFPPNEHALSPFPKRTAIAFAAYLPCEFLLNSI